MSNRGTKGKYRVGSISVDTSGSTWYSADRAGHRVHVIHVANASTCETDTGYDLPSHAIVNSVDVLITTGASAGSVLNVGLLASESGGDADGFLALLATTSGARLASGVLAQASSSGWTSTTFGTFLEYFSAATVADPAGHAHPKKFFSNQVTAKSVSYYSNSTGPSSLVADLIFDITELTT